MQKYAQPSLLCASKGCGNASHPSIRYCFDCRQKVVDQALQRFPEPPEGRVWIYFIRSGEDGPIKIGQARDPEDRLICLQTGSAERLTIETAMLGAPEVEFRLHRKFAEHRIRGEWFQPAPEIQALIVWAKRSEKAAREKRLEMALGTDAFEGK